jgi:hypothetical protein
LFQAFVGQPTQSVKKRTDEDLQRYIVYPAGGWNEGKVQEEKSHYR